MPNKSQSKRASSFFQLVSSHHALRASTPKTLARTQRLAIYLCLSSAGIKVWVSNPSNCLLPFILLVGTLKNLPGLSSRMWSFVYLLFIPPSPRLWACSSFLEQMFQFGGNVPIPKNMPSNIAPFSLLPVVLSSLKLFHDHFSWDAEF